MAYQDTEWRNKWHIKISWNIERQIEFETDSHPLCRAWLNRSMNSIVFWVVTLRSYFGDVSDEYIASVFMVCLAGCSRWILSWLTFSHCWWSRYAPPKRRPISKLHGVTTPPWEPHIWQYLSICYKYLFNSVDSLNRKIFPTLRVKGNRLYFIWASKYATFNLMDRQNVYKISPNLNA
jgi:hypothetical protein